MDAKDVFKLIKRGALLTPEQAAAEREAACAEMRERAALWPERLAVIARSNGQDCDAQTLDKLATYIRSLPLPTNALQRALAQARLEEAKSWIERIIVHQGWTSSADTGRIAELQRLTETP